VPRVEEEGSSARVVGARRGAPYGPQLGPGTRGGGVGGGAPGLETTAALGRGQGCEATAGSGARRSKTRAQSNWIEEEDVSYIHAGTFSPGSWLEPGLKAPGSSQEPGLNVFFSFLFIYAYNN